MVKYISVLMAIALPFCAFSQIPVCDNNICIIEEHGGVMPVGEIYNVVSPVGKASVKPIEQASRLSSLDGKTIAIVGGSFMVSVTHPEIE